MPTKWNEPPEPIPSWLDPSAEVTSTPGERPASHGPFVVAAMRACLALRLTPRQAAGVVANAINEASWGRKYRAWNLGGWKITRRYAAKHPGAPWWRAPGNKSSGDKPWCYYRAFPSMEAYFAEWVEHFVPKPGVDRDGDGDIDEDDERGRSSLYRAAGDAFWSGGEWFPLLIQGGYKGRVTKANPDGSIREHASLVRSALRMWAQSVLGVTVDGEWGPASREALAAWQVAHELPSDGELTDVTLETMGATRG